MTGAIGFDAAVNGGARCLVALATTPQVRPLLVSKLRSRAVLVKCFCRLRIAGEFLQDFDVSERQGMVFTQDPLVLLDGFSAETDGLFESPLVMPQVDKLLEGVQRADMIRAESQIALVGSQAVRFGLVDTVEREQHVPDVVKRVQCRREILAENTLPAFVDAADEGLRFVRTSIAAEMDTEAVHRVERVRVFDPEDGCHRIKNFAVEPPGLFRFAEPTQRSRKVAGSHQGVGVIGPNRACKAGDNITVDRLCSRILTQIIERKRIVVELEDRCRMVGAKNGRVFLGEDLLKSGGFLKSPSILVCMAQLCHGAKRLRMVVAELSLCVGTHRDPNLLYEPVVAGFELRKSKIDPRKQRIDVIGPVRSRSLGKEFILKLYCFIDPANPVVCSCQRNHKGMRRLVLDAGGRAERVELGLENGDGFVVLPLIDKDAADHALRGDRKDGVVISSACSAS